MANSLFLVLCVIFSVRLHLAVKATDSQAFVASTSGQQIPIKLVEKFVRVIHSTAQPSDDPDGLVYEITKDGILHGKNLKMDILRETKLLDRKNSISYELNGENDRSIHSSGHVREGSGITVFYDIKSDQIINIWGRGLFLKPLHSWKYPGIFINIHSSLRLDNKIIGQGIAFAGSRDIMNEKYERLSLNATLRQSGSCASGKTHYVELAVAYDNTFCELFSNSEAAASAYVQSIVSEADVVYRRDTCVSVALVHLEAHCQDRADPYRSFSAIQDKIKPSSRASRVLDEFRSVWISSRSSVRRDAAIFISGLDDGTSTTGVAYIGACCGSVGYGYVERGGMSTFVHELGHLLSCTHTSDGVMRGSGSGSDSVFFSAESVSQITNYIDSFGRNGRPSFSTDARCIDTSRPQCDSTCPGECVKGQCIAKYSSAASPDLVPCTPVQRAYLCTTERTFSSSTPYTFGVDCPAGFEFIQRQKADINVFCCLPPTQSKNEGIVTSENARINLLVGTQSFPGYVSDSSSITQATLMKSVLVPSCQASSNSSPTNRPPTTTRRSRTTLVSVTTRTRASEPQTRTCGATLATRRTFKCSRSVLLQKTSAASGKAISLEIMQRSGKFTLTASVSPDMRIVEMAGLISSKGNLKISDLGRSRRMRGRGVRFTSISTGAFQMAIPRGKLKCCGEKIFAYAVLRICRWNGSRCYVTRLLRGNVKMQCMTMCAPGSGRAMPFSRSLECPLCI